MLKEMDVITNYVKDNIDELKVDANNTVVINESEIFGKKRKGTGFTGLSLDINGKRIDVKIMKNR
jgi:hypothetical protein